MLHEITIHDIQFKKRLAIYKHKKQLKRHVKRNIDRFPKDFMFTLTRKEFEKLEEPNWHLKLGRFEVYADDFTGQGVAMPARPAATLYTQVSSY